MGRGVSLTDEERLRRELDKAKEKMEKAKTAFEAAVANYNELKDKYDNRSLDAVLRILQAEGKSIDDLKKYEKTQKERAEREEQAKKAEQTEQTEQAEQ